MQNVSGIGKMTAAVTTVMTIAMEEEEEVTESRSVQMTVASPSGTLTQELADRVMDGIPWPIYGIAPYTGTDPPYESIPPRVAWAGQPFESYIYNITVTPHTDPATNNEWLKHLYLFILPIADINDTSSHDMDDTWSPPATDSVFSSPENHHPHRNEKIQEGTHPEPTPTTSTQLSSLFRTALDQLAWSLPAHFCPVNGSMKKRIGALREIVDCCSDAIGSIIKESTNKDFREGCMGKLKVEGDEDVVDRLAQFLWSIAITQTAPKTHAQTQEQMEKTERNMRQRRRKPVKLNKKNGYEQGEENNEGRRPGNLGRESEPRWEEDMDGFQTWEEDVWGEEEEVEEEWEVHVAKKPKNEKDQDEREEMDTENTECEKSEYLPKTPPKKVEMENVHLASPSTPIAQTVSAESVHETSQTQSPGTPKHQISAQRFSAHSHSDKTENPHGKEQKNVPTGVTSQSENLENRTENESGKEQKDFSASGISQSENPKNPENQKLEDGEEMSEMVWDDDADLLWAYDNIVPDCNTSQPDSELLLASQPYIHTPSKYGYTPSKYGSTPSKYGLIPSNYGSAPSKYGSIPSKYGSTPSAFGNASQGGDDSSESATFSAGVPSADDSATPNIPSHTPGPESDTWEDDIIEREDNNRDNVFEREDIDGDDLFEREDVNGDDVFEREDINGNGVFEREDINGDDVFEREITQWETQEETQTETQGTQSEVESTQANVPQCDHGVDNDDSWGNEGLEVGGEGWDDDPVLGMSP